MKKIAVVFSLLLFLFVQPVEGAIMWEGKFRVNSVAPWDISIIEGHTSAPRLPLRSEKTGLPEVRPSHWVCTGRVPSDSDVGKVYEFWGVIPDIGGHYSFGSKEASLSFRSKWCQWDESLLISNGMLLLLVLLIILVVSSLIRRCLRRRDRKRIGKIRSL